MAATAMMALSTTVPAKIVMKGTSRISLHDRFTQVEPSSMHVVETNGFFDDQTDFQNDYHPQSGYHRRGSFQQTQHIPTFHQKQHIPAFHRLGHGFSQFKRYAPNRQRGHYIPPRLPFYSRNNFYANNGWQNNHWVPRFYNRMRGGYNAIRSGTVRWRGGGRGAGGYRGYYRGGGRLMRNQQPRMSKDDLDRQLDDYMSKANANRVDINDLMQN